MSDSQQEHSWIREYWQGIESGEIIVGYYVREQVSRLVSELDNPAYKIDLHESQKRINFIEKECRHSEAPFAGKPFKLLLFQKAIIEAIFAIQRWNDELGRYIRKYQEIILVLGRKNGKAIDVATDIPTPYGWKKMGELQIGDTVFAVDGTPAKIITVSPVRLDHACYRVTFEDGATILADAQHLWTVTTKKKREPFVVSTVDMLEDFAHRRKDGKGTEYKYRVPVQLPVQYPEKDLPIPPYVLGLWLGNGDSADGRITGDADDIPFEIEQIRTAGEEITSHTNMRGACERIHVKNLSVKLRAAGLLKNKHIPQDYLQSSVKQRMELLQGLMDTDGTCSKAGQCEFVQKSRNVTEGVMELLDSLGIKNTVSEHIPTIDGRKCAKVYRVQFWTDKTRPCFKLPRKYNRLKERLAERMKNKSIRNIEFVQSVPVKCIGIDHPSHLYLAGRKFTATHNTPLASAISLSEWVCGEMGTKILYGSNDYDQADLLYMATDAMREAAPKLARCTRRNQKGIFWGGRKQKSHAGKFSAQNKGSIRKLSARTSAKEGKNIKVGIVDEVHEMKDNTLIMPIKQALSTQDEPIYIEITTEGFTDNGYLDERLMTARQVLEGEVEKDNLLIFWYTQDSEEEIWRDEKSWYKSNPTLGQVKKWSFLRGMIEDARLSASTKAFVLAKDFNIKQNSAAAWLSADVIDNQETFDPKELEGQFYIGGFDYAETTDLCAAKAVFVNPWTLKKRCLGMYFIPEVKADAIIMDDNANHLNPEQKNYRAWAEKGLVTICPGTEVDPAMVSNWYVGLLLNYNCRPYKIGFDNWHAKQLKDNIESAFGPEVLERVGMDFMSLNGPMASLESDLTYKKLNYNDNEVDRWCFTNTAFKLNNVGLKMPVKVWNQAKNRIDGTLGLLTAYAAYSRFSSTYLSLQKSVVPQKSPQG